MSIPWTPTGGTDWTEMTRAEFDAEAPLVLFEAAGTRQSRRQAQKAASEPDLFSLDGPPDECE